MGVGYNESVAASNSARGKASTRTPVHFYLNVPMYEYDLGCGRNSHLHTFQSRTPFMNDDDDFVEVWCSGCQQYRKISIQAEPLNRPVSTDDLTMFEQDKGILRERIALKVQDMGMIESEEDFIRLAQQFGVKISEVRKINAGLRAPEGLSGLPDLCSKGLHEMTVDNIALSHGRRQCKACKTDGQRARRAAKNK